MGKDPTIASGSRYSTAWGGRWLCQEDWRNSNEGVSFDAWIAGNVGVAGSCMGQAEELEILKQIGSDESEDEESDEDVELQSPDISKTESFLLGGPSSGIDLQISASSFFPPSTAALTTAALTRGLMSMPRDWVWRPYREIRYEFTGIV